ncbi:hypothetical protein J2W27_004051 [Variovorax boronicumulans]|uniref:hypothetical protein n=1 Tax=Variovorax boronicumulans TaxID=436515 RepID=UPI0027811F6D|nr:hypothetical protein [Variovorax boronicumulans]MDP9911927.1 hypothetical protein [Variovorax boronicumulans]
MAETQIDEELVKALEERLTQRHGLILPSAALAAALGYPTMRAYHQAVLRQTIPVRLFHIEHRRGRFALARDVARWLAQQYQGAAGPLRPAEGASLDAASASLPAIVLGEERGA